MAGNVDAVGRAVDLIKAAGVPGGIGSHSLETPIASEKHGLNPDYYVKTFHPDNYWSATPAGQSRGVVLVQRLEPGPRPLPRQHLLTSTRTGRSRS